MPYAARLSPALPRHGGPVARLERVLAVGRAFLTVSGLTAIYLDPTQPARLAAITYAVLAAYALYSVAVLIYVHRAPQLGPPHGLVLHGLDVLWTAVLTFVGEGPGSPFFLFFLFVVVAAAYRWGFVGTVATAVLTVAVYMIQTIVEAAGPWNQTWFAALDFQLNATILRVTYLLLAGFLLGYLAEQDKRSRAELAAIAEVTQQPRVHLGLGGSIAAVARGLRRTFDADAVHFVLQDYETHETHLWRLDRGSAEAADPPRTELATEEQAEWLFDGPGRVWEATRQDHAAGASAAAMRARIVDPGIWPLRRGHVTLPPAVAAASSANRVVAASLGLADEWRGRVYLFNPTLGTSADESLHFLDALMEHVTPALTNVFLMGRLRARVTAAERARVARELHDGSIQALFGVEMKIEALRRRQAALPPEVSSELEGVQEMLRREVLALRELMQALRPIELDASDQLADVVGSVVERFRRDTGVPARFVFTGRPVSMPPARALEVVRIVQEALVNVRKHSRARNVLVRLTGGERTCTVAIEDDGVGFGFEGRLSSDELNRRRIGPAIIRERARIAGAELWIDSTPGSGARIELTLESAT